VVSAPASPGQHYLEAEVLLAQAYVADSDHAKYLVACAQVHATLAASMPGSYGDAYGRWRTGREKDNES
jgi:hypothetical protein